MKKESFRPWGFNDLMVVAAFRYCLGRRTYIVGVCADWLIAQWPNFSDSTKDLIQRELEEAFKRDATNEYKPLGDDCDHAEWERVRGLWKPVSIK